MNSEEAMVVGDFSGISLELPIKVTLLLGYQYWNQYWAIIRTIHNALFIHV